MMGILLTRLMSLKWNILLNIILFVGGIYLGWNYTYSHYQIKEKQAEIAQLKSINNMMDKAILYANNKESISNEVTKQLKLELTTLQSEYDYANQVILRNQNTINKLTHIDNSFLRVIQLTESSISMPQNAYYAIGITASRESISASGLLSYTIALKKYGDECVKRSIKKDKWYDDHKKLHDQLIK